MPRLGAGVQAIGRTHAIESQAFVFYTVAVLGQSGIDRMNTSGGIIMNTPGVRSSAIFGPDGTKLSVDIPETEEGIIYADFDRIIESRSFVDVCGHHSRLDLLWLGID